ncbi:SWI/SNF chromatin-remodeling complex subunit SWI1, partial [Lecanoromycetidae sp. Uapishka_2]
MSMPTWLNDAQTFPSNDHGAFNNPSDPSMGFMHTPTTSSFDFNQMQNQQLQQRMQNGNTRNGSPAYHNPVYPTQTLVPSKRPRPQEDGVGASPQQHPGILPASRSQTPQGQYPGFQGTINGNQQFSGPNSYPQFQQASNNPNQSPSVPNQTFNPHMPHQRVSTMSPSPFSPATQNFSAQASPPHSEHGSRVNTPQNGNHQYPPGMPYGAAPNQTYTPPPGSMTNGGASLSQYNQHLQRQQHQQRSNEARMRQIQQQYQQQGGSLIPAVQMPNQISPQQVAAMRQQAQSRANSPEQLLRTITSWTQQHGLPFDPQPLIAGRPISAVQLFMGVMKMGGSKRLTVSSQWPNVATFLQFSPTQAMAAAQDLQSYWQSNLAAYEQVFMVQQQQQQHQRRTMAESMRAPGQLQGIDAAARQGMFSPTKQLHNQQGQQLMQPPPHLHAQYQTPPKATNGQHPDARQMLQNGYLTPQQAQAQGRPSNMHSTPQAAMQAQPPVAQRQEAQRTPGAVKDEKRIASQRRDIWPSKNPIHDPLEPRVGHQGGKQPRTFGGLELNPEDYQTKSRAYFLQTLDDLLKWKLSLPKLEELGVIDVRTLIMSLRSGLHPDVRHALDTLSSLCAETQTILKLDECEDLLESLVECANDQLHLLADHSAEVSDAIFINSYEETVRGCKVENMTLQDTPEFGSLDYELDRAADKLICITTMLRNLSFLDRNHQLMADPTVIQCISTAIRYIGTRSMLLRTHQNLLDFNKDTLIFLTNVSHRIDLPGKEEALCILHFLLSFAPMPVPNNAEDGDITFSPYIPGVHRYYPHAVDSLAKLLARDDPNRTIYRSIFATDSASTPPYDLLTRAFGLAIATMPEVGNPLLFGIIKARAPNMVQGLLSAEILASLIPPSEHELARSWLASQDGFALSLLRIVSDLSKQPQPQAPPQRDHRGRVPDPDPFGIMTITERGFAVLRKLAEKAKDADGIAPGLPFGILPDKRTVVAALAQRHPDHVPRDFNSNVIRQLCALSSLDT